MTERTNCIYCGKLITMRSREHIIQNAIGGLYESEDICCPNCNNYVSKFIDAPFTKTFNPIISRIESFAKTNNKKSHPLCTGKAMYENEIYDVSIKNSKVIACPELSKKLHCDVSKLNFEILAYNFPIENASFKNGIAKIAFNFAIEKGICIDVLKKGLNIQEKDEKIENISFNYPVIPFVALNPMDKYIELATEMELYHNLILFNQRNMLWCYVDLFNTFQYYVLLSDEWDGNISVSETYLQLLQKIDRTIPELYIRKPKHILSYSMYFNIEPCMDLKVFKKRVSESIQKESLKKDMSDVLSAKLGNKYIDTNKLHKMEPDEMNFYLRSLLLYFDEDDRLKDSTFRRVTNVLKKDGVVSYPMLINAFIFSDTIDVRSYIFKKFERLNSYLAGIDKEDHV
ncbi:HNH endonuclease [Candidatus Clostridium radicumherbarum]|uniref:HNH endonuclease n=1 Tax=Candidatus Clostridium radicumherbarum TaxID=3381662 RepID=A0ABW8TY79_9CLOT